MRILASGKRDSVTGEEVVVAVPRVVASSGYSTNLLSNSSGVINDNGVLLAVSGSSLGISDKLGGIGLVGSRGGGESEHAVTFCGKQSKLVKSKRAKVKKNREWKYQWNKSSAFLRDYCLAWNRGKKKTENSTCYSKHNHQNFIGHCESSTVVNTVTESSGSRGSAAVIVSQTKNNSINVDNQLNICTQKRLLETGTAIITENMRAGIYHEKQVKSLCALHALNNLLQDGKAFKQEDLDKICSDLDPNSWVNPHKSVFGLGNYDINVIMTALQQKQLEAIWFDKRKDPSQELNFDNIYGFILNIPSDCKLGWLALPIKRKHWVAIRNLPSVTERDAGRSNYYNLDSKFDKPESIGSTDNLIEYLRSELRSPEKELFLVVMEDVGRTEIWRKNPPVTVPPPSGSNQVDSTASSSINTVETSNPTTTNLLPVPGDGYNGNSLDTSAGSGVNRRTSNDSGVVDLLPDLRDINVVDLNKEDLMRRQSSGVWSDLT